MVRGLTCCDASPALSIDSIMVAHTSDSFVEKTRPRKLSATWRSMSVVLSTELTADRGAREADEHQRPRERFHLAEDDVGPAVDQVADGHQALVRPEGDPRPDPMCGRATDDQAEAGAAPEHPDACRAAIEHHLTKQREEDLRGAAA